MSSYRQNVILTQRNPPPARTTGPVGHSGTGAAPQQLLDFGDIWATFKQGKWIILITTLLITGSIAAYTKTLTPVYRSSSRVQLTLGAERGGVFKGYSPESITGSSRELASELALVRQSSELEQRVIQRLQQKAQELGDLSLFPILLDADGNLASVRQVMQRLPAQFSPEAFAGQNLITLTVESSSPVEAAEIANTYAAEYEQLSREMSRESMSEARDFLQSQVDFYSAKRERLDHQWEQFVQDREILTAGASGDRIVNEYVSLQDQREQLQLQIQQEELRQEELRVSLNSIEPGLAEMLATDELYQDLVAQRNALSNQIGQLEAQVTVIYATNPDIRAGQEEQTFTSLGGQTLSTVLHQIDVLRQERQKISNQIVQAQVQGVSGVASGADQLTRIQALQMRLKDGELNLRTLQAQLQAIDQKLPEYDDRLSSVPRQTLEHQRLEAERDLASNYERMFRQELMRAEIAERSELGYVKILRPALEPLSPVRPNMRNNTMLGLIIGLSLGVGLAFLRRAMDRRLRRPEDLPQNGYDLVGVIPAMDEEIRNSFGGKETAALGEGGREVSTKLITLLDPWSSIAENYRLIRTNIQYARQQERPRVLLVTSPEISDGKTVTTVNLAVAMVQSGLRTLLIDADLRRPSAHRLLRLEQAPGLADLLTTDELPADPFAPYKTDIEGLYFVPAGDLNVPPAEMLGTQRMQALVDLARDDFDVVLIDSPPVLVVTDALILATQVDATLLVVSAERTDLRTLEVAKSTLESVGVPLAGTILNRFDAKRASYGYGYGYSYSYRYGEDYGTKPRAY